MAGTAAGAPERHRRGNAHPTGGLPLVCGVPRRGRSPARPHDGVVEKAGAGVPEPGRYPENKICPDEPDLSAGAAAHLRGQKSVPRRTGVGNTLCHAGACTEDAELRLRASGGGANDLGAGVGTWQRQGKEVLRISAEGSQAESRCHCRSDGAAAERGRMLRTLVEAATQVERFLRGKRAAASAALAAEGVPADQECSHSGGGAGAAEQDHIRGRRCRAGCGTECHLQCSVPSKCVARNGERRVYVVGGTGRSCKAVGSTGGRR